MGIKSLGQWLRNNAGNAIHTIPLESFSGQRLAVDASIYLYKFICVSNAGSGNYFDMFLSMILWLRKKNIRPVFVFDGKAPPQKNKTKEKRRETKEKLKNQLVEIETLIEELEQIPYNQPLEDNIEKRVASIYDGDILDPRRKILKYLRDRQKKVSSQCISFTADDIKKIKDLLDCLGLPWIQSEYEAEKTCSWLCRWGYVKGVITGDSDVLVYKTDIWITDVRANDENCRVIRYDDVISEIGLTPDQFTDFCIMCGTDYNDNIPGIGPAKAYNLILEHGDLDELSKTSLDTAILYYEDARKLFTIPDDIPDFRIPQMKNVDVTSLDILLFTNNSRYKCDRILKEIYKGGFEVENG
jgi:flap endonuclease-1